MDDVTHILRSEEEALLQKGEALFPLVYDELRRMAYAQMASEKVNHTLQPTALVHEAWLRLVKQEDRTWQNRAVFFSAAATSMRRVLVEHARKKGTLKRGGDQVRVDLDVFDLSEPVRDENVLRVEDALVQLEKIHPKRGRVVTMKYYGGMTNHEVAEAMELSESTVERYWAFAKVWLYDRIRGESKRP